MICGKRLSAGGRPDRCGWLTDKYGLSWQIIPAALGKLMSDPDPEKSKRVMQAMLQMDKIDIKRLEQAYQGEVTTPSYRNPTWGSRSFDLAQDSLSAAHAYSYFAPGCSVCGAIFHPLISTCGDPCGSETVYVAETSRFSPGIRVM